MKKSLVVLFLVLFTQNIIPIAFKLDQSIYKGKDKNNKIVAGCFNEKPLKDLVVTLKQLGLDKCDLNKCVCKSNNTSYTLPALIVDVIANCDKDDESVCGGSFEILNKLDLKSCNLNQIAWRCDEPCTLPALIIDVIANCDNKSVRKGLLEILNKLDLKKCDLNQIAWKCDDVSCTLPALIVNVIANCDNESVRKGLLEILNKLDLEKCDLNKYACIKKEWSEIFSSTLPALIIKELAENSDLSAVCEDLFKIFNELDLKKCNLNKCACSKKKEFIEDYTLSDLIEREIKKYKKDEQVCCNLLKKIAKVVNKLKLKMSDTMSDTKKKETEKTKASKNENEQEELIVKSVEIQLKKTNIDKIGESVGEDSLQIDNASIGGDKQCNQIKKSGNKENIPLYKKNFIYSGLFSALMNLAWETKKRNIEKNTPEIAVKVVTSGGLAAVISYLATRFAGKYTSSAKLNIPLSSIVGCVVTNLTFPIMKKRCESIALKCNLERLYNNIMKPQKALNA